MPTTMNLIAKQTIGAGGAASVIFSSIPQTFTDLKLVVSLRSVFAGGFTNCSLSINGSSANFSSRLLESQSTSVNSYTRTDNLNLLFANANTSTSNTFSNGEVYFPNYTSSNNKSFSVDIVAENNAAEGYNMAKAGLWSNTAAISSLTVTPQNGTFGEFSEVTLYGISSNTTTQNQTTPSAIGGDTIITDGTYWYHTFLYSGTFTPLKNLTCDYLVVAGGGAGSATSNNYGGGGGAGGLRSTVGATGGGGSLETPLSLLANTAYTAIIGAGGVGENQDTANAKSGNNSTFATITSTGGGGAGRTSSTVGTGYAGSAGGSGGGGTGTSGGTGGAASPSGQGYAGGNAGGSGAGAGGGGGGAGSVGSNGSGSTGGNGGSGVTISISGSSVSYAGGGGGSSVTAGTATAGGGTGNGTSGTPNTGGGGGGKNGTGGSGGSGIIVVRYAV
jgi:hypothetical protein